MSSFRHAQTLDQWRIGAFKKRAELAWPVKLGLALLMAGLTGLAAQIRVPLPHTTVPLTGQVFAVLLSGVLLGGMWGGASQILYVGLGAAGVPWFAGMAGGVPLGPTAGYLLGFIVAATLIGWATERRAAMRNTLPLLTLMVAGIGVIYAFGAVVYSHTTGAGISATLRFAVAPFIALDVVKAVAAAGIATALLPKGNGQNDSERP